MRAVEMRVTLIKSTERLVLDIPDKHAGQKITLPTGHTIDVDMIGTVWLTPSGRDPGVQAIQPDKKIEQPVRRRDKSLRATQETLV